MDSAAEVCCHCFARWLSRVGHRSSRRTFINDTRDRFPRGDCRTRELKTRLGTYLRRVREGRTLLVTDRGEPVAELRPLQADTSVPAILLKLSGTRAVTLPLRKSIAAFEPIRSQGRALSDAVRKDREDRF